MTGDLNAACTHPRAQHQHGTYACAVRDRCGCEPCLQARRRANKGNAHQRATGTPSRIDAAPARAHAQRLESAGMGRAELARLAGIDIVSVTRLLRGDMATMRRDRAARVLAVTWTPVTEQALGLVPACGIIRRAEALACLGWSQIEVLRRAGLGTHSIETARRTGWCFASTRAAIAAVYDELWDQWPPETPSTIRTRTIAARRGYAPAMAWDDDALDDPHARPHVGKARAYGHTADDIADMIQCGRSLAEITASRGITADSVRTALNRNGHGDLWQRIAPRERKAS